MALTRGIDQDDVRQAIVAGIVLVAQRLGIRIIAEGIETAGERDALLELGIRYMQGFLFARPQTDRLCLP
jgi:EAL domain-containing protein (putative c-di-GMP-specific phosphodiesterase class I)